MDKTVDQRRAEHAWEKLMALKNSNNGHWGEDAEDYTREAKKLPVRIMASGLGQALSFIKAKANKKNGLRELNSDLSEWVIKKRPIQAKEPEDLLQSIISDDSDFLRRVTDEALSYLQWLNRFAEAEGLPKEAEN